MAPSTMSGDDASSQSVTNATWNDPLYEMQVLSKNNDDDYDDNSMFKTKGFWKNFPSVYLTRDPHKDTDTDVVNDATLSHFLKREFSLPRVRPIESSLWMAGSVKSPRSLTARIEDGSTVVLTKSLDMHLVWGGGKVFIKPLPRYLLEHDDFQDVDLVPENSTADEDNYRDNAKWFLFTYACLLADETDFELALELHIIPKIVENRLNWAEWRDRADKIMQEYRPDSNSRERFKRSELRLNRLNCLRWLAGLRQFKFRLFHRSSIGYFGTFSFLVSWITPTTVYVAIVLTAMQVGLATKQLQDNHAFHTASYGFTVFALIAPISAVALVLLWISVYMAIEWHRARPKKVAAPSVQPCATRDPSAGVLQTGYAGTLDPFNDESKDSGVGWPFGRSFRRRKTLDSTGTYSTGRRGDEEAALTAAGIPLTTLGK